MEHEPLICTSDLRALGACDEDMRSLEQLAQDAQEHPDARLGRVVRAERSALSLLTRPGNRITAGIPITFDVVVGDWVTFEEIPGEFASLIGMAPRRSAIARRSSGDRDSTQILAANVDNVVITIAADQPMNYARVERMLVLSWESGATPIVALTKAELLNVRALKRTLAELAAVAPDTAVVSISALKGWGIGDFLATLKPGGTVALLGSSGAGKSTLINVLTSYEGARTAEVRLTDNKGRHTTAWRELVCLPGGGVIIDTPGLRQLGLRTDYAGLRATFAEVDRAASSCRFSNCTHQVEPGCAVVAAISAGTLDRGRVDRYEKLLLEADSFVHKSDTDGSRDQRGLRAARSKFEKSRIHRDEESTEFPLDELGFR